MKVAIIFVLLLSVTVAKHHHNSLRKSITEAKDSFFGNVNVDIHALIDNLFGSVNLNKNFTEESNSKLLLTMHYDLNNIAYKNFDALNEIQNIITVNVTNQTQEMKILDTVIDNVLNEKGYDVYNIIRGKKHRHRHKHAKRKTKSKRSEINSDFGDSKEFSEFVMKFLAKVNNLTIKDFKRSSKHSRNAVPSLKNLKVWEPPSNIEFDYINGTNTRRVFKGTKTQVKTFPFIVSIHIMGEFACAGCIISRDLIITAASCLQVAHKTNPKSIYVRLGSDYTLQHGETIPAQKLYFHPNYNGEYLRHNLAIIKLEKRIRFSRQQKRIRRIMWDKTPENLAADTKNILILGWGATKSDQVIKEHQKLSLDMLSVYNYDECRSMYSEDYVYEENFCAGFTKTSGGACNGDVGGPGIVGAVLMGIVSFGAPVCGAVDSPTVFTKLGYYVPWIESIMDPKDKKKQANDQTQNARRKFSDKQITIFHFNMSALKPGYRAGRDDYTEEVKILRELLFELVNTDTTVVDEALYGELYEEFNEIFKSTEIDDNDDEEEIHFPFVNKSYYTPEKYFHVTRKPVLTTTTQNPMLITPINTKVVLRRPMTETKEDSDDDNTMKSNDYTDNYEKSSQEEHGLSIEVSTTTTEKYFFENQDYIIKSVKANAIKQSSSEMDESYDKDGRKSDESHETSNNTDKLKSNKIITKKPYSDKSIDKSYKNKKYSKKNKKESVKASKDLSSESRSVEKATKKNVPFMGTRMELEAYSIPSDKSIDKSYENKKYSKKNKKESVKASKDLSSESISVEKATKKIVPFMGTRMVLEAYSIPWGLRGRDDEKDELMKHGKKGNPVSDEGKSLATKPFFYEFENTDGMTTTTIITTERPKIKPWKTFEIQIVQSK